MKTSDLIELKESVDVVLNTLDAAAEDHHKRETVAKHLATLMVLRDMDLRYKDEADPLKSNTLIDYIYGEHAVTTRALNAFHRRIEENPRARKLMAKYVEQFMNYEFGAQAIRYRVKTLRDHFNKRKDQRVKFHEETLINNFNAAQDKLRADYQEAEKE